LVPLTFEGDDLALMRPLAGLAVPAIASAGKGRFREAVLFTHRGLSGPAILQASSYWREGEAIALNLSPEADPLPVLLAGKAARPNAALRSVLAEVLPARLAAALAPGEGAMAQQRDRALGELAAKLRGWRLVPSGTEGHAKAEVTLGGIATSGLSQQTMMAKAVPGLFAIGEAVDVTGWLGGYNFQWAWSSGWCAGMAI
jgi:predicted Rossmann fold flavoprotein